jgi:hypothetical protein
MRDGTKQVGVERHGEAGQHGGCPRDDHHRHERRGQRGNLRGLHQWKHQWKRELNRRERWQRELKGRPLTQVER